MKFLFSFYFDGGKGRVFWDGAGEFVMWKTASFQIQAARPKLRAAIENARPLIKKSEG